LNRALRADYFLSIVVAAFRRVHHLGAELQAIDPSILLGNGGQGRVDDGKKTLCVVTLGSTLSEQVVSGCLIPISR
jgi:hypothetical protein